MRDWRSCMSDLLDFLISTATSTTELCVLLGIASWRAARNTRKNLARRAINASPDLAAELARTCNINGQEAFWLANGPQALLAHYAERITQ
jgi:hypothetical protein